MTAKTEPRSFENASEEIGGSSSIRSRRLAYRNVGLSLFCGFWFCFLGFPSERITHSNFHLDEKKRFAGYRCFGDISVINALIGAQIAGES